MGQFVRRLGIVSPQNRAVAFLGIYLKDAPSSHKDTCTNMFIAALLIANNWTNIMCPAYEMCRDNDTDLVGFFSFFSFLPRNLKKAIRMVNSRWCLKE